MLQRQGVIIVIFDQLGVTIRTCKDRARGLVGDKVSPVHKFGNNRIRHTHASVVGCCNEDHGVDDVLAGWILHLHDHIAASADVGG